MNPFHCHLERLAPPFYDVPISHIFGLMLYIYIHMYIYIHIHIYIYISTNAGKATIAHPYFDGLSQPFMINLGLVGPFTFPTLNPIQHCVTIYPTYYVFIFIIIIYYYILLYIMCIYIILYISQVNIRNSYIWHISCKVIWKFPKIHKSSKSIILVLKP